MCTMLSAGGLYCQNGLLYTLITLYYYHGHPLRVLCKGTEGKLEGPGRRTCDQKELISFDVLRQSILIPGLSSFELVLPYFSFLFLFSFFGKFSCLDTPYASLAFAFTTSDSHDPRGDCRISDVI
ncbi:hypothetical protein BJX70DRAFT_342551 [Aspergillus crustosus]